MSFTNERISAILETTRDLLTGIEVKDTLSYANYIHLQNDIEKWIDFFENRSIDILSKNLKKD